VKKTAIQLDAEIAEALRVPDWLASRKKERVDPARYAGLVAKAVKFPEFSSPSKYTWDLVRDVPIHYLNPGSRIDYEMDPESDDEEVGENVARYDRLVDLLVYQGKRPWPIVVGQDGEVIDGYHRLAVLSDNGAESVDVLWVRPKRAGGRRG
jgi:hypothetical protein